MCGFFWPCSRCSWHGLRSERILSPPGGWLRRSWRSWALRRIIREFCGLANWPSAPVAFYEKGLARIEDRWAGSGETGERFDDPHHVYAGDLDLFGKGSLFQLLSTARTRMGEDTLAQWLLSPSAVEQIRERHAAVDELRDQLDLREDLAVLGEDVGVGVHPEALLKWAESPNQMKPLWLRWLSPVLAALAVAGALCGRFGELRRCWC